MSTMAGQTSVNATNIDTVDVDNFAKENGTNSEKSCDSGIVIPEACSETFPTSSDSETSPTKSIYNDEIEFDPTSENIGSPAKISVKKISLQSNVTSSSLSISPEDNCSPRSSIEASPIKNENTKEFEKLATDVKHGATNLVIDIKEINVPENEQYNLEHSISTTSYNPNMSQTRDSLTASCISLDVQKSDQNVSLASSSISLDENPSSNKVTKLPLSRSAENISHSENINLSAFTIENKDIDKEEILTQFSLQKRQANATQRIPENTQQTNTDIQNTRIPKEILSQDIGSIVKNVHGMFSSVSGSLKYYTHRTAQKPVKHVTPIPNGKVMTDIFEDETNEFIQKDEHEIANSAELIEEIKDQGVESKTEILRLQIESLERLLFNQRKENTSLRERVKQQVDECQGKDQMFKDLEGKLDSVSLLIQSMLTVLVTLLM